MSSLGVAIVQMVRFF